MPVPENAAGDFGHTQDVDWEQELVDEIVGYRFDPLGFVNYAYPWGEGELARHHGPRTWQADILGIIGDHLQDPATRYTPLLISVASGHGIGKSAEIGFLDHWGMSCWEDPKIVITANTDTQLKTKTSPEIQKWFRLAINSHWFDVNATSIKNKDKGDDKNWRTDFIPWSEENTEAFQGLHNEGKIVLVIFDEASGVADKIWEVTEGALTDENTVIIWIAFGNPTQNTGRFRECFGRFKHRWVRRQIDSRTVEGTNKEQIAKWEADYGDDSDFFRVRVRGEFPRVGSNQLISSETVAKCRKYKAERYDEFPKILGVDVARFGDDQTVMVLRQGRKATVLGKYRGKDVAEVTAQAVEFIEKYSIDAVIVDSDGIGAPVFDNLKFRGYGRNIHEFHGGKPAQNHFAYFNRRSEVWGLTRDWLEAGAEIPDDPEMETDLTGPSYGFSAQQQVQLERKDDMKKRGLSSPDVGDALAMTFAVNIRAKLKPKEEIQYRYPGQAAQSWMG